MPSSSSAEARPFIGYVDTTADALRLIQAARCGLIPRITRRLNEMERRTMIRSGAVFVFSVDESGIKRWTDGSHILPYTIRQRSDALSRRVLVDAQSYFRQLSGQRARGAGSQILTRSESGVSRGR